MASKDDCETLDFVPGYNLGGEGFDIASLTRRTSNIVDMESFLDSEGTCKTYQNTQLSNSPRQKVPQSISTWKMRNTGLQDLRVEIYNSASEYTEKSYDHVSNSWSIGLDFAASGSNGLSGSGGFSVRGASSKSSQFARQEDVKEQSVLVEHKLEVVQYEYSLLNTEIPLTEDFISTLNRLPFQYVTEEDRTAYNEFFEEYGTHVINKVTLGGRIKALTVVRSCELNRFSKSVEEVANCLTWEARLNIGYQDASINGSGRISGSGSHCKFHNHSSDTDIKFSSVFGTRHYDITGGNVEGMADIFFSGESQSEKYKAWMKSLKQNPDVIFYDTKPIFVMIKSVINNAAIKNIKSKAKVLKYATDSFLYGKRKVAESEVCSASCAFQCPFGGKANNDCGCQCKASDETDSNCCPKKIGIGKLIIKDLRMEDLHKGDIFSKPNGWIGTISPPLTFKQTGKKEGSSNLYWSDVWDMGDMIPGTEVCIYAKGHKGGVFHVNRNIVDSCCVRLDGSKKQQLFQCAPLFATAEFSCHQHYSGAQCDIYDRKSILKPNPGVCMKPNLRLAKFTCNDTCAQEASSTDEDGPQPLGSTVSIAGLSVGLVLLVALVIGGATLLMLWMRKRNLGHEQRQPILRVDVQDYGTHDGTEEEVANNGN
jgi:hypothetical protein